MRRPSGIFTSSLDPRGVGSGNETTVLCIATRYVDVIVTCSAELMYIRICVEVEAKVGRARSCAYKYESMQLDYELKGCVDLANEKGSSS